MPLPANPLPKAEITACLRLSAKSPSGLEWKVAPEYKPQLAGKAAGCRHHSGYWDVMIQGVSYRAHRVVWYLCNGQDPGSQEVDHIDRDLSNNSPNNLRLADRSLQVRNTRKRKSCSSSYKGVTRRRDRWIANIGIWVDGRLTSRPVYLGIFNTEEEAWAEVLRHRPDLAA